MYHPLPLVGLLYERIKYLTPQKYEACTVASLNGNNKSECIKKICSIKYEVFL